MEPIQSLPSGEQRQKSLLGKKKTGISKQFQQLHVSSKNNQQPRDTTPQIGSKSASSAPLAQSPVTGQPVQKPGGWRQIAGLSSLPRFTLGDLRKGELAKLDTLETPSTPSFPRNSLEHVDTVEIASLPTQLERSVQPPHPQGPNITKPLQPPHPQGPKITKPLGWYDSGEVPRTAPIHPGMPGMPPSMPMVGPAMSTMQSQNPTIPTSPWAKQANGNGALNKGKVLLLIALLCVIVVQGITIPTNFLGTQGWATILGSSQQSNNLLTLHPKGSSTAQASITPQAYIDGIIGQMSLDQKLGQMMMVQFTGPDETYELDTMITQYHVGAVLLFVSNGNITSDGNRLKALTHDIQTKGNLPLTIATDQEGGEVDRMAPLSGASPSAAEIGATNDPNQARLDGEHDAQHLSTYGINLNLAPVVDVNTLSTAIVNTEDRTYSSDPTVVAQMASAYLQGLQKSGKVLGTLKHFPGLGAVAGDPHQQLTYLRRSRSQLDSIDWAPYRTLIQQGSVHAIMVTHTYVTSIDADNPASLSPQVQAVLRQDMSYQGVLITDSLQMAGVSLDPGTAAAMAVKAGSDMIMGASSPDNVSQMINGIKQIINSGVINEQRINESVRRILMMKYAAGLLSPPQ